LSPGVDERDGLPEESVGQDAEAVLQDAAGLVLVAVVDVGQKKVGREFVA
jgi:hypothetical protein